MTEQQHPITPPLELVRQWRDKWYDDKCTDFSMFLATQAARWGADQELEACIDVILAHPGLEHPELLVEVLRAARRPKPPSLAEQAFDAAKEMSDCMSHGFVPKRSDLDTIRRALVRLQELENHQ